MGMFSVSDLRTKICNYCWLWGITCTLLWSNLSSQPWETLIQYQRNHQHQTSIIDQFSGWCCQLCSTHAWWECHCLNCTCYSHDCPHRHVFTHTGSKQRLELPIYIKRANQSQAVYLKKERLDLQDCTTLYVLAETIGLHVRISLQYDIQHLMSIWQLFASCTASPESDRTEYKKVL